MLKINYVSLRNFLSVGAIQQHIVLNTDPLTLILGDNKDVAGNGSRNGVGKTSLVQAISYALYGEPLTKIKKDNLINATNTKEMLVIVEFEKNNKIFRIERGRKPTFLRWFIDNKEVNSPETEETQGESKWTQNEIKKVVGMSHMLFKQIVALHTKTTTFLSLSEKDQREIIEELLGITALSLKADQLKELIKLSKDAVREEEIRIKAVLDSNSKIRNHIDDLNFRSKVWENEHKKKIDKLANEILTLEEIDVTTEIDNHRKLVEYNSIKYKLDTARKEKKTLTSYFEQVAKTIQQIEIDLETAKHHSCPTCGQNIHDLQHSSIISGLEKKLNEQTHEMDTITETIKHIDMQLHELTSAIDVFENKPVVVYDSIDHAYEHKNTLEQLRGDLDREVGADNPYIDQVANLSTSGLQEVSYDLVNELNKLREHQEFIYNMLKNKDSPIRKSIITQSLPYLNQRLNHYLDKLGLPHEVRFLADLDVEITLLGREYDFEQISAGEANRLILALSWAFRDVWENINHRMNIMVIDELVDSHMDSQGIDNALDVLKKVAQEDGKNVYIISHKDEIVSRVNRILLVQKENGFTTYHDGTV
jgi:DNA repair exonuclease SbcCD ATPase subunit